MTSTRRRILESAADLIDGDRHATYGPPEASHNRIAALWTAAGFSFNGGPVTGTSVAIAMSLMKTSRIIGEPTHEDSWMDAAAYIAIGAEMALPKPEATNA